MDIALVSKAEDRAKSGVESILNKKCFISKFLLASRLMHSTESVQKKLSMTFIRGTCNWCIERNMAV